MALPRTVDSERADIDSGKTGDKIAFPDPAAAPLGTDAEAAGYPPTSTELQMESAGLPGTHAPPSPLSRRMPIFLCAAVIVLFALAMFGIAAIRR